jgi:hypothetical protein
MHVLVYDSVITPQQIKTCVTFPVAAAPRDIVCVFSPAAFRVVAIQTLWQTPALVRLNARVLCVPACISANTC